MNFPTIDRSFFAGECFDAYRVLGAHPCGMTLGRRLAVCRVGPGGCGCGDLRRL